MDKNDQSTDYQAPPPAKGSSGAGWVIAGVLLAVVLGGACICTPILAALLLPAIQSAKQAANVMQSSNNLKQIGLALHSYHTAHNTLPPAYIADEDGNPMTSWRTMILPQIEQQNLYDTIDFTRPWDDPVNSHAGDIPLAIYRSPRETISGPRYTNYVAITGDGTLLPGAEAMGFGDARDGLSNTIMVVEILNSDIQWNEPRDLELSDISMFNEGADPTTFTNVIPRRGVVLFADGAVMQMNEQVTRDMLQTYSTSSGDEPAPYWPGE